jgi:hypothetical protein
MKNVEKFGDYTAAYKLEDISEETRKAAVLIIRHGGMFHVMLPAKEDKQWHGVK